MRKIIRSGDDVYEEVDEVDEVEPASFSEGDEFIEDGCLEEDFETQIPTSFLVIAFFILFIALMAIFR